MLTIKYYIISFENFTIINIEYKNNILRIYNHI